MLRNISVNFVLAAAFVTAVVSAVPRAAAHDEATPTAVPANLQVPECLTLVKTRPG